MSEFDVFLCHNSQDKPEVIKIAEQLKTRGLKPWLDIWELPPGQSWQDLLEKQIEQIKSAAVFVGSSGFGPWQKIEMRAFIREFIDRHCPVIPVLLENAPQEPKLPILLQDLTWVDFRQAESDPMGRLIWGITGDKPADFDSSNERDHMKTIKIFLASSSELESDRKEFEIFINRKNKEYVKANVFLELVLWEDFLDAMSQTRLQDEYNKAIAGCDVFVSLFHTKVGKYTEEEFLKALETFKANGKPLIYTYFKDAPINMSKITPEIMSLLNFKQKLNDLGHFYTNYTDINDLKFQFNNQLTKFLPKLKGISPSKIEQHSENEPQTVTKVEQHFHGTVGIATGNIEGNQNLKDINTEGDREDIRIKPSNNPRLKYLQKQKEQIESRIAEVEKLINECYQDINAESNTARKSQLYAQIDNFSTEIDKLYDRLDKIDEKINKLKSSSPELTLNNHLDNPKNQQELNIDKSLCELDFKKALETFENIQSQFNQDGDVALFFMEESFSKKGDLCLQRLKSNLKPKTSYKDHFRYIPVTYTTGNLEAVAQGIANFLKITQKNISLDEYIKLVIKEICKSLQRNSVLFIEINCDINHESEIDLLIPWFINKFWKPLRKQIKEIPKKYTGIKVIAVISSNLPINQRLSTENLSCYCNNNCHCFEWDKLVKIPLGNWTEDDIKNWLIEYSHPSLTESFIDSRANRIFNESGGLPRLVCDALQQQWQILINLPTSC